jgi:type II secretory pathway pseudopilin PulG
MRSRTRRAFTIMEATAALAIIAIAAVIVAQAMVWSLRERARFAANHAALELAANTLEAARAEPFENLDQAWADGQGVPSEMDAVLPAGKLMVTIEDEKATPLLRRVTVEVTWQFDPAVPVQKVSMATMLSARQLKSGGTR